MVADVVQITESKKHIKHMQQIFKAQTAAFRKNPMPSYEERIANLKILRKAILDNQTTLAEKIAADFSARSKDESRLADLMPVLHGIDYNIKNLKSWMRPAKRKVSALFAPASAQVMYQPLGVVGIIAPWNYTISLSFGPLVSALAAGNRAMIKMSEFTPETSEFVKELIGQLYPEDLVSVVTGDAEIAAAFSDMPWNHLLFTGSTSVGRHVMRAAAANLTPVTLELGGKSPTIISDSVDMDQAVQPIVFGKSFNAGQTCIAPDYILCPEHRVEHFVNRFQHHAASMYPSLKENDDYSAIINQRQHARLLSYIDDAQKKGATVITCNPADDDMSTDTRKMPIHLVINPSADMTCMQDEIFGPILPIIPVKNTHEAIEFINDRPAPLALYYFGHDKTEQTYVLEHVRSGGVCLNDTLSHFAQEDLHFGGVGESGMGSYHGEQGFLTFSHAKSIFNKGRINSTKMAYPPFGTAIHKVIYSIFFR